MDVFQVFFYLKIFFISGHVLCFRSMTGLKLQLKRREFKYLKFFITDEISMVSYELLRAIHLRLVSLDTFC